MIFPRPPATPFPPAPGGAQSARLLSLSVPLAPPSCDAAAINGRLVFEGIRDGLVNPRLPSSRAPLAALLPSPGRHARDDVFAALLATFPGPDAPARIKAAEAWAATCGDDAVEREIAFLSVRRLFLDGRHGLAVAKADSVAARFPDLAGRAGVVKAFALAQSGDCAAAARTLSRFEKDPRFLADRAEIRFMQAWIAIEEDHRADAASILRAAPPAPLLTLLSPL